MASAPTSTASDLRRVLELDPGLAEGIPPVLRERAVASCLAREMSIPTGRWRGTPPLNGHRLGIGLLVLEGLLVRRVGIEGRFGAELLGEGDLLRPSEGDDEMPTLAMTVGWRVLETARVAVLDDAFMGHLADYPELGGRLVGRAVGRSRNIAVNMAIVHQARVDVRLHMLFWHLAARWGRVGSDGVTVPLQAHPRGAGRTRRRPAPDRDERPDAALEARHRALDRQRLAALRRIPRRAPRALERPSSTPALNAPPRAASGAPERAKKGSGRL